MVSAPVLVLEPSKGLVRLNLGDVWAYRELLVFLIWRDVKVRYKQTALGAAWAIIQPVMTMVVFSVFFGRFAKMPSDGIPYPVFAFAAVLPWQLFASDDHVPPEEARFQPSFHSPAERRSRRSHLYSAQTHKLGSTQDPIRDRTLWS